MQFLNNDPHVDDPRAFLEQVVQPLSSRMNGFNLVVADLALNPPKLAYLTNGSDTCVRLCARSRFPPRAD